MTAFETDILAELVGKKHDCLVQLREMGEKQLELVRKGNMTGLLEVLSVKQRVIVQIQRIERALDPFRGQAPERRRWRTPEERRECAEKLAECESLLSQILGQEKQSEHELIRRRDAAAVQLQGAHRAGQARGAYTTGSHPIVNQIDLSSES